MPVSFASHFRIVLHRCTLNCSKTASAKTVFDYFLLFEIFYNVLVMRSRAQVSLVGHSVAIDEEKHTV
jgi:hypothetical protein